MEELTAKIPSLIERIKQYVKTNNWAKNDFLNEWCEQKFKIIDRDVDEDMFQDNRYVDLNLDHDIDEGLKEYDNIISEIDNLTYEITTCIQNIESGDLHDDPGFGPAYERFIESLHNIISLIPVRDCDDVHFKYPVINDDLLSACKKKAIDTLSYTYSTASSKNFTYFISKDSGIYARSTFRLKEYVKVIARMFQTNRSDIQTIITPLIVIKNTYSSYKAYFDKQSHNGYY